MRGLIIDDHALFREGLRLLLEQTAPDIEFDLAADIASGTELLSRARHALVLLDWNLEKAIGAEGVRCVREAAPAARIVIVSGETAPHVVRQAVEAGASGYVPKTATPEELSMALRLICAGGIYLPPGNWLSRAASGQGPADIAGRMGLLTDRQVDVFKLLVRGLGNKEIGRELDIAEPTVKSHVTAIFRALDVRNRTEAVYAVAREGLNIG